MRGLRGRLWIKAACLAAMVTCINAAADPVGPAAVAAANTTLWPDAINSAAGFDKASRASLLIYVRNLKLMQAMSDADMLTAFKIKSVNRPSVEKWLGNELALSLRNYQLAATGCAKTDWTCAEKSASLAELLRAAEATQTPASLTQWRDSIDSFTHTYIAEQMRLAALFPKVTSEIDTFSGNEWTGADVADRQFHLTFDDGPTVSRGSSDDTLAMLAAQKKSATFFILGANFQNRINATSADSVKAFYGNQCVALHGWEHQSHAKWEQWQDSILRSQSLVAKTIAANNVSALFRPPYGQRREDSGEFFKAQQLKVALWNIDSQDWNARIDAKGVESRIVALMLIKRHGVILFHDIHPKAKVALPEVFAQLGDAVSWSDCHALTKM